MHLSPFLPRGRRPFCFPFNSEMEGELLRLIPGTAIHWERQLVRCTWDAVPVIERMLKAEPIPRPKLPPGFWAGAERYKELGFHEILRPYQKRMVRWLGRRDAGGNFDQMRLGKTITTLATAVARGARRILVLCPGYARPTWCREIPRWLREEPVLFEGRAAECARYKGERIRGADEVRQLLRETRIHIANFDILSPARRGDFRGQMHGGRYNGITPLLRRHSWDACIVDEAHELKAPFNAVKGRDSRADLVDAVIGNAARVPIVYLLTATPMGGMLRHYYQLFRLAFGKVITSHGDPERAPSLMRNVFDFEARYCNGRHEIITFRDKDGIQTRRPWKADGVTHADEFTMRKKRFSLGRTADTAGVELPDIVREVRILPMDPKVKTIRIARKNKTRGTRLEALMGKTISIKAPAAVEEAIRGARQNNEKCVIFVRYKSSFERTKIVLQNQLAKLKGPNAVKNLLLLSCTGSVHQDVRAEMCDQFISHKGPVIFVATIESLPGSLSLRGLHVNYFLELHDKLNKMQQAEGRGHEPGTNGVMSIFFTVENSYDDTIAERTVARLNALARIEGKEDAAILAAKMQKQHDRDLDSLAEALAESQHYVCAELEDVESEVSHLLT